MKVKSLGRIKPRNNSVRSFRPVGLSALGGFLGISLKDEL
jgi:hypothetical protein